MLYFSILLCLACLAGGTIIGIMKYKKWYNPMSLLNALFFVIVFFASFRFFSYKEVHDTTYLLLAFAALGYNVGCILTLAVKHAKKCIPIIDHSPKLSKYVWLMDAVLFVLYVCELINVSPLYVAGADSATIRGVYFEGNMETIVGSMDLWSLIRPYIEVPLTIVCVAISCVWLINYKNYIQFIFAILFVAANIAVSYGRFVLFYIVICLLLTHALSKRFLLTKKNYVKLRLTHSMAKGVSLKNKKVGNVKWFVAIFAGTILYLSVYRGVDKFTAFFYEYFCGCVFLLDQLIQELPENSTWGVCSFQSIIAPIYTVLHQFGIPYSAEYMDALNILALKDGAHVISEKGQVTNAFSTPIFALYADFGLVGVFWGMCLLGFIFCEIYQLARNKPTERNICLYAVVGINLFKCIQEYPFSTTLFTFTMAFIWLLYRNEKVYTFK